jgi:hypothetical protein
LYTASTKIEYHSNRVDVVRLCGYLTIYFNMCCFMQKERQKEAERGEESQERGKEGREYM